MSIKHSKYLVIKVPKGQVLHMKASAVEHGYQVLRSDPFTGVLVLQPQAPAEAEEDVDWLRSELREHGEDMHALSSG